MIYASNQLLLVRIRVLQDDFLIDKEITTVTN